MEEDHKHLATSQESTDYKQRRTHTVVTYFQNYESTFIRISFSFSPLPVLDAYGMHHAKAPARHPVSKWRYLLGKIWFLG